MNLKNTKPWILALTWFGFFLIYIAFLVGFYLSKNPVMFVFVSLIIILRYFYVKNIRESIKNKFVKGNLYLRTSYEEYPFENLIIDMDLYSFHKWKERQFVRKDLLEIYDRINSWWNAHD